MRENAPPPPPPLAPISRLHERLVERVAVIYWAPDRRAVRPRAAVGIGSRRWWLLAWRSVGLALEGARPRLCHAVCQPNRSLALPPHHNVRPLPSGEDLAPTAHELNNILVRLGASAVPCPTTVGAVVHEPKRVAPTAAVRDAVQDTSGINPQHRVLTTDDISPWQSPRLVRADVTPVGGSQHPQARSAHADQRAVWADHARAVCIARGR
jgi:hypothetical protein